MHSRQNRFLCGGGSSDQSTNRIARKPPSQFATSDEIRVSQSLKITKARTEKEEEEEAEKEKIAASALLRLASQDPWTIKKKLTPTDVSTSCRLLISMKLVHEDILPYLSARNRREIESEEGLLVGVRDCDTGNVIHLRFKWWHSSKSYVFNEGWKSEFVDRRGLKPDDEIGLFWNQIDDLLVFSVLNRAVCKSV